MGSLPVRFRGVSIHNTTLYKLPSLPKDPISGGKKKNLFCSALLSRVVEGRSCEQCESLADDLGESVAQTHDLPCIKGRGEKKIHGVLLPCARHRNRRAGGSSIARMQLQEFVAFGFRRMTEVASILAAGDVGVRVCGGSTLPLGRSSILCCSPSGKQCDLIHYIFHLVGQSSRRTHRRCWRLLVLRSRQSRAGDWVFGL